MPVENLRYVELALELVNSARDRGIPLRILGSLAYRLHCPANIELFEAMKRDLTDIDFATRGDQRKNVRDFLGSRGYLIDKDVLVTTEGKRYAFTEPSNGLNIDVFFDELFFCHAIPLKNRLDLDFPTITPTDLLLEKMQIVEINPKDIKDSLVLLLEHDLEVDGRDAIDHQYTALMLADDWGFYYTMTQNLARLSRELDGDCGLSPTQTQIVRTRIENLTGTIEETPKSRRWKLRARIGPRKRWYQEVAEKAKTF
jgi:hypothetical protein